MLSHRISYRNLPRRIAGKVLRSLRQSVPRERAEDSVSTVVTVSEGAVTEASSLAQLPAQETVTVVRSSPETTRLRLRTDAVEKRLDAIEGWARTSGERTAWLETMASEIDGFRMARAAQIASQERLAERFVGSLAGLAERVDALSQQAVDLHERLAVVENRSDDRVDALLERIDLLERRHEDMLRAMSGRSQQIARIERKLDGASLPKTVQAVGGVTGTTAAHQGHALDGLYLAFEDRARGSLEEIAARQAVYLPLVDDVRAGTADRPILDLGAGRGEWLEVLRDRGLVARGVDTNDAMVATCRAKGLDCTEIDALAALDALPDASVGLITGFHIIEHLPYEILVSLLDEALRVLVPGGALVFETPDPQNVIVGSHTFYMDPTHRNPVPSGMVRIIAEVRGFANVEIRRLNPSPSRFSGQDHELIEQLNALFFGPQDYAMIAYKI